MTVFIQRLPTPGTGDKLYPDAAMDAGTRGLIHTPDAWSWGGALPAEGSPIAVGNGPLNYPLAEDGWTEDQAQAVAAMTFSKNGVRFTAAADRMKMPVGFEPQAADTDIGLIWWMKNAPVAAGNGFNNRLFSFSNGYTSQFDLIVIYDAAPGVVASVQFQTEGLITPGIAAGTAFTEACFDGALHQFALRMKRAAAPGYARVWLYLDGKLFLDLGLIEDTEGAWTNTPATHFGFGLTPGFAGSGLNGYLYRAVSEKLDAPDAGDFGELVARDYALNQADLLAASV